MCGIVGIVSNTPQAQRAWLAAYREWGTECLARFNSMYVFALFDARQHTVLLAPDSAGEKPLFYHQANSVLRFASELKELLAEPALTRLIDPVALDCYLDMGYVTVTGAGHSVLEVVKDFE